MWAAQRGHAEVVGVLLTHGAEVDLQNNVMMFSGWCFASRCDAFVRPS